VVVSALFSVLGVLATLDGVWTFFGAWSIASACSIVMAGCCAMLNVRSFRVLTETSVRAYFV
jgi:amino acid transporter